MPPNYHQMVAEVARQYKIPVGLAEAQINQESGFNPNAGSSAGAQGIAQFMPATGREYGVTNPYDPTQALQGYGRMMSSLISKYGIAGALSAYNSGSPTAYHDPNFAKGQTYNYVKNIMGASSQPVVAPTGYTPQAPVAAPPQPTATPLRTPIPSAPLPAGIPAMHAPALNAIVSYLLGK